MENDLIKDNLKNSLVIFNETQIPDDEFIENYEQPEQPYSIVTEKPKHKSKNCKNKETIFETNYINSSYSLIHAYKCMPKPNAKSELFKKELVKKTA